MDPSSSNQSLIPGVPDFGTIYAQPAVATVPDPSQFGVAGTDPFAVFDPTLAGSWSMPSGSSPSSLSSLLGTSSGSWGAYALYAFLAVAAIVVLRKI
ncbi:MAG TPA: hypothetical protein VMU87_01330 [Stellaceae bacterium]|nr:hypothetical protein [Stellaceae bacterium]